MKTSLAPGSKVVTDYLERAGLTEPLEQLGFDLVGYGCTTCIGNSGPLPDEISAAIEQGDLRGRLGAVRQPQLRGPHPLRGADELPRVAAAGGRLRARRPDGRRPGDRAARRGRGRRAGLPARHLADPARDPRHDRAGRAVRHVPKQLRRRVHRATSGWNSLEVPTGDIYDWPDSTYVRNAAVLRRDAGRAGRSSRSAARACSRCSATA